MNSKLKQALFLFLVSMRCLGIQAQVPIYGGGDNDGMAYSCYEQGVTVFSGLYSGGNNDGTSFSCYEELTPIFYSYPFQGGLDANFTFGMHCATQLDPVGVAIFFGGNDNGSLVSCYSQNSPLGSMLFFGGDEYGFNLSCYDQSAAPSYGVFTGGSDNGDILDCYLQQNSSILNAFYGGSDKFEKVDCYLQNTPISSINIFQGGNSGEFAISCTEQLDYLILLPVELVSFMAECKDRQTTLSWSTATELNSSVFLIEKSIDNIIWENISEIPAAGNSQSMLHYSYVDIETTTETSYYRLKQYDIDGNFEYSPIRSVNCDDPIGNPEILTYPNPVNEKLNIQFSNFKYNDCFIQLVNSAGKIVYSKEIQLTDGQGIFELNRSANMAKGFYFIVVKTEMDNLNQKIIFQ